MRTKTMIAAVAAVVTITCHKKNISAYRLVNL